MGVVIEYYSNRKYWCLNIKNTSGVFITMMWITVKMKTRFIAECKQGSYHRHIHYLCRSYHVGPSCLWKQSIHISSTTIGHTPLTSVASEQLYIHLCKLLDNMYQALLYRQTEHRQSPIGRLHRTISYLFQTLIE